MMEQLSKDLDFPFKRNGSLVVCLHEDEMPGLEALYKRGITNGVPGLRILNREELRQWSRIFPMRHAQLSTRPQAESYVRLT